MLTCVHISFVAANQRNPGVLLPASLGVQRKSSAAIRKALGASAAISVIFFKVCKQSKNPRFLSVKIAALATRAVPRVHALAVRRFSR